ncbi:L-threonylcarbamoyladenylate synthase [Lutimaribacter sp. EGI FJ00015]|uniref:L-threonylcarbamoyladenylate synthase n=1 Tax=Lutimaribacter degradans TaxID=2945989 RepID=A0ACC5ZUW9_9RHOB|nr:L-threonylcarbamoyladenylate synthase [Lutimaribacter sp. EGI FJ00013]MCM2561561.1 L-threonylcarbamoyladenylate synthase [Lutimaribacter sp. EGI FJ00013]MCO0612728.1 L-threonylcarbamoyladenylate synthase [Lutimaribacter sp. EGI FJ00015]MCO0635386.1 L-threonylcarbamoyladenylate synthase [Lutimaribacter sp. EGI FJ00014]
MGKTEHLQGDATGIVRAAELLSEGRLVALPTETVYGLAGDARCDHAVARIFDAKGRPSFNPLIVHLPDATGAARFVQWTKRAQALADAFWPGPLTLVLPLKYEHGLSPLVTAGLDTVALRVPAHPLAQAVLRAFGGPVAAPSANPSGRISPTTAAHVLAGLDGRIDAVMDGGACTVGVESTIVGLSGAPTLLRPGGIAPADIEAALGVPLALHDGAAITAPGQLGSHYAPGARVRLEVTQAQPGEVLIGFGAMECDLNLSPGGDLVEAAANLFHHLHAADRAEISGIAVAPVPETGLGLAINDRLRRAAAPRD